MQKLQPIRIIVANAAIAKLFYYDKSNQSLDLTSVQEHEKSKMKASELKADEPGRYQKSLSPNEGTYAEPTDPKTEEALYFARHLVKIISKEAYENAFGKLLFVASGDFQGKFKQYADKRVIDNIKFVDKDYTKLNDAELEKRLKELVRDINVFE